MRPNYDVELEDSKPIFLHDTLDHDDASSIQVWLQKDLECSYSFFSEDTLAYDDVSIIRPSLVAEESAVQKIY